MPAGLIVRRLNRGRILEEGGVPLARLSSLKSIPVVEAFARRPAVERPGRAQLVVGCVVPFSEGGRAVVIAPEDFRDAGSLSGPGAVVPGEPGGHFGDDARVHRVVIATGQQR